MLILALGVDVDLRDRYPGAKWLVYERMAEETTYQPGDTVLLSEWFWPDATHLLRLIQRMRQGGARVIYLGSPSNETDDWKRILASLGVYDWLFLPDIDLKKIDGLIQTPRTAADVSDYLTLPFVEASAPPEVVEVLVEATDPIQADESATPRAQAWRRFVIPHRRLGKKEGAALPPEGSSAGAPGTPAAAAARRVVWKEQDPVRVAIVGDPGVGKTFLAWNLASLCDRRELPTAVMESAVQPLTIWAGIEGVHVYVTGDVPKRGYRVQLFVEPPDARKNLAAYDLVLAVVFPDRWRIGSLLARLRAQTVPPERVLWIVNRLEDGAPAPDALPKGALRLPHEVRQGGAMRMHTPLSQSDPAFAARLAPIVRQIEARFMAHVHGQDDGYTAGADDIPVEYEAASSMHAPAAHANEGLHPSDEKGGTPHVASAGA